MSDPVGNIPKTTEERCGLEEVPFSPLFITIRLQQYGTQDKNQSTEIRTEELAR
jgi:hypothetical protein